MMTQQRRGLSIHSLPFCLSLFLFLTLSPTTSSSGKISYVESITDHKAFKKLLRTKNNVLIHFSSEKENSVNDLLDRSSVGIKGIGTIGSVDCSAHGKLCKKLKISFDGAESSSILKHYQNGKYHLDYNRSLKLESLVYFIKDPTGDIPWHEDPHAYHVHHLTDPSSLKSLLKVRLKPIYQKAAETVMTDIQGAAMAAMDVNRPENAPIRKKFNITAFPTILYFEGNEMRYQYPGENDADSFVNFLKNPSPEDEIIPKKAIQLGWKDEDTSTVVHLDNGSFDEVISKETSINVMFYAPWCGHCKKMKPHFSAAANRLHDEGVDGKLGAVDCTSEDALCKRLGVKGYPTVKYFKNGKFEFDSGHAREEKTIVEFMKNPNEPPPPPPPEKKMVRRNLRSFMFYAPWCGHCKKAKSEFGSAAELFRDNPRTEFAAIDCIDEKTICSDYNVSGQLSIKAAAAPGRSKKKERRKVIELLEVGADQRWTGFSSRWIL
ncbi:PDIA5 [Lepeophtheirus salmonis]|uniref:PDIA5 n=1 Tax=Lepeophtheirus salmonis TaxID=72036 RepID=A0A7R8CQ84_LEPSM|nr:PDIA5 [Lepeophtheirus salmonis]CAF2892942.1 PDIA5 [Lepeophtheirus salmonis]